MANIFPLAYMLVLHLKLRPDNRVMVYVLIASGFVVSILLANLWRMESTIFGRRHSTALLSLTFFTGAINCMTSLVFLPVLSNYLSSYASPFTAGEGMSGLLASLFSILQNSTKPPLFSVDTYFYLISLVMLLSGGAFTLILLHKRGKNALQKLPAVVQFDENITEPQNFQPSSLPKIRK